MAYPVSISVDYPEKLSRGVLLLKVFLGSLYVGIPHGIMLALYQIGVVFVVFIAFWAILFTGRFPRGMHNFIVGYLRWNTRVASYLFLLHDDYPPFSGEQR